MLEFSHSLWVCRNTKTVHVTNEQGLPPEEAAELADEIDTQYALGTATLLHSDHYLLESQTKQQVHDYYAHQKRMWVDSIRQARENYTNREANETNQMRQFWHNLQSQEP